MALQASATVSSDRRALANRAVCAATSLLMILIVATFQSVLAAPTTLDKARPSQFLIEKVYSEHCFTWNIGALWQFSGRDDFPCARDFRLKKKFLEFSSNDRTLYVYGLNTAPPRPKENSEVHVHDQIFLTDSSVLLRHWSFDWMAVQFFHPASIQHPPRACMHKGHVSRCSYSAALMDISMSSDWMTNTEADLLAQIASRHGRLRVVYWRHSASERHLFFGASIFDSHWRRLGNFCSAIVLDGRAFVNIASFGDTCGRVRPNGTLSLSEVSENAFVGEFDAVDAAFDWRMRMN